jgi:hypothetical protein
MPTAKSILVTVNPCGYEVTVLNGASILDHYVAGNSPEDSVDVLPPNLPGALSLQTLKTLSLRTAQELADEYGIPHRLIDVEIQPTLIN